MIRANPADPPKRSRYSDPLTLAPKTDCGLSYARPRMVCRSVPPPVASPWVSGCDGGVLRAAVVASVDISVEQRHAGDAQRQLLRRFDFGLRQLIDACLFDGDLFRLASAAAGAGVAAAAASSWRSEWTSWTRARLASSSFCRRSENFAKLGRGLRAHRAGGKQQRGEERYAWS